IDMGSTDVETDTAGLGVVKGLLTFISVGSWVIKIVLATKIHIGVAVIIGVLSGAAAFWLLNYLLKLLVRNEENVNWSLEDSMYQKGEVYLRIPPGGQGIVNILIKGAQRELKAKSRDDEEIKTGESVLVTDFQDEYVIVQKEKN
ncbi:MAG: hypothetical protein KJO29_01955, partial [Bacteroidia bacterium]|nr:hypothetical protein [Bacteroidia bacterium]